IADSLNMINPRLGGGRLGRIPWMRKLVAGHLIRIEKFRIAPPTDASAFPARASGQPYCRPYCRIASARHVAHRSECPTAESETVHGIENGSDAAIKVEDAVAADSAEDGN